MDVTQRPRPLEARLERQSPVGMTEASWLEKIASAASAVT
jgi:hypothetical protein